MNSLKTLTLTTFTDPMMGLSYESELIFMAEGKNKSPEDEGDSYFYLIQQMNVVTKTMVLFSVRRRGGGDF